MDSLANRDVKGCLPLTLFAHDAYEPMVYTPACTTLNQNVHMKREKEEEQKEEEEGNKEEEKEEEEEEEEEERRKKRAQ